MFIEFAFKTLEQGEGIGRAAGKTGNNLVFIQPSDLAGIAFHHRIAHRHLTVTTDDHLVSLANREDCRAAILFQARTP